MSAQILRLNENERKRVLDTLDFTRCISGHADPMTRDDLYRSFTE